MENFLNLKFNFDGEIYGFNQYTETPSEPVDLYNIEDLLTEKWLLYKTCEDDSEVKAFLPQSNSQTFIPNTHLGSRRELVLLTNFEVAKTKETVLELSYSGKTEDYYFQIETPYIPMFNFNLLNIFTYVNLYKKAFRLELDLEFHTILPEQVLNDLCMLIYQSATSKSLYGVDVHLSDKLSTMHIVLRLKEKHNVNITYISDYIIKLSKLGVFSLIEPYLIYYGSIEPRINNIYYTNKDPIFKLTVH